MISNFINHNSSCHIILFEFLMLFLIITTPSNAQSASDDLCNMPGNLKLSRPDPQGPPTDIDIEVFVIDVNKINDVDQTFLTDIFIIVKWKDPRLSKDSLGRSIEHCRIDLGEIWNPELNLVNIGGQFQKIYKEKVTVDTEGNIRYGQRGVGSLLSPLDLEDFPFDKQILPITFVSVGYGPDEVTLNVKTEGSGIRDTLSIVGWNIKPELAFETFTEIAPRFGKVSLVEYKITAERKSEYFIWLIMLSLSLIVLMAWSVFWIDPSQLGPQIGISTASIFTLIAFRLAISTSLPKVSFLTVMDKFILFSTLLVFFALGVTIVASNISKRGNENLARWIDILARWVYLGLFIIILVYIYLVSTNK